MRTCTVLAVGLASSLVLSCGGDEPSAGSDGGTPSKDDAEVEDDARPPSDARDAREAESNEYPDPGAWPKNDGPGGPVDTFEKKDLLQICAYLDGGPTDVDDHHNLVVMYDGYLLMPWAPESGGGGITLWDVSHPCKPKVVGAGTSEHSRETHYVGFSNIGGKWTAMDSISARDEKGHLGTEFWDLSDVKKPKVVSEIEFPETIYPDAYKHATMGAFWQGRYVYAGGGLDGFYIIDAKDPRKPRLVQRYDIDQRASVGQVQAIGNLLLVTGASLGFSILLDISDPENPQPIPGGQLSPGGDKGGVVGYFTNFSGGFLYHTRNDTVGGLIVWDIRDPSKPELAGEIESEGKGGYVFVKGDLAFSGQSDFGVIYDVHDVSKLSEKARVDLPGDLDTVVPIGNVAVLSVDDEPGKDQGSAVVPWATTPDTVAPRVTWVSPSDGSKGVARTSRVGVTVDEFVDPGSAWEGSVRLYETKTKKRVSGWVNAQEGIVNFTPEEKLLPKTDYTFEIPAGGIADLNGNPVKAPFSSHFTTAG